MTARQMVVLSGKGGTGKTTVIAGLATLAASNHSVVLADADVDAANLALVLDPVPVSSHLFKSGELAVIDPAACAGCGRCAEVCRFEAIVSDSGGAPTDGVFTVDEVACEGCAACFYECPAEAIRMVEREAGAWFVADTHLGPLYHAHLFAGEENSGKLVTLIKQMARLRARDDGVDLLLVDGPPGIGCPVISTLAGADLALIVTEPTVAGAHDLARILGTADHFGVRTAVLVNKADLNPEQTGTIRTYCTQRDIPVVGELPYDPAVTEAMVRGETIAATDGLVAQALRRAWEQVAELLSSVPSE